MPFLDGGGPCGATDALADRLVDTLLAEARRQDAGAVEIRSLTPLSVAVAPRQDKVNLVLRLPSGADRLWRQLDGGVRNQVRKAERGGLTVELAGAERLSAFYDVHATRMRDLGSPVHALGFFRAIFAAFGTRARLVLAWKGGVAVGGLVTLAFKDTVTVPWASCRTEYFALCPNMLLYWEAIRVAATEGFRRFDFGRSSRESGTYRFKRQWGAEESPLFWYRVPLRPTRGAAGTTGSGAGGALLVRAWRRLPVSLTRRLGPPVRRYLTQ
jgi:FemAB-related protein (PEP-CTERM system-associated)